MSATGLSSAENERTVRQQILPELGDKGQLLLRNARVAVVGAGGLGSPVIEYLVAAGVGHLTVIDDDVIEPHNLHRQTLHDQARVGEYKTSSAVLAAARLSPECTITEVRERLTGDNALSLLGKHDLLIDGSDSFDTRFVIHHAATELHLPVVWGAVLRWDAQVTVFWPSPPDASGQPAISLEDVFPDTPEVRQTVSCSTAGIMGAVCGQAGSLMALEAIKLITGIGKPLLGRMIVIDGLTSTYRTVDLLPATESDHTISLTRFTSLPENVTVIDVRRVSEREAKPGPSHFVHVPLNEILTLTKENPQHHSIHQAMDNTGYSSLVLVCSEGVRSVKAARHLAICGYDVKGYLDGGLA